MKILVLDREISEYRIVCPENAQNGEDYFVTELCDAVHGRTGDLLPVASETAGEEAFEIIVGGNAPTMEEGGALIRLARTKLTVGARDLFGYMQAATFFRMNAFSDYAIHRDGNIKLSHEKEWRLAPALDFFKERTAAYRVMFHNIWGVSCGGSALNRQNYAAEYHLAYGADVIGFNEYWDDYYETTTLRDRLLAGGYAMIPARGTAGFPERVAVPLFYRVGRLDLLECFYVDLRIGVHGACVAVFEGREDRKRFIVAATHLPSAWDRTAHEANLTRLKSLSILLPAVEAASEKWGGIPALIGGDYNASAANSLEPCQRMKSMGYAEARDIAVFTNDQCSCHGYPKRNEALNAFVSGTPLSNGNHLYSIDHTMIYRPERVKAELYRVMNDPIVPVIADHCPQLTDFTVL